MLGFGGKTLHARFGDLDLSASSVPVVVELFTSQSCSSCPPADKVLSELADNPNVIALSCHVDYWDHLHWKDTLSQSFCTDRQRSYARAMNSRRVYTPQMVVNGRSEFVGSNRGQAGNVISKAQKTPNVKMIEIAKSGDDSVEITLPQLVKGGDYTVWIMGYNAPHTQSIPSGENRGRTVLYKNSVTALDTLGRWSGEGRTERFTLPKGTNTAGLAVIAQDGTHGHIAAAGKIGL